MAQTKLETILQSRWHGAAVHGQATALSGWPIGIAAVDRALAPIGIPRGRLTELWGSASCGKTTLAYALMRTRTVAGDLVGYVDPERSLFAPAAHAAGIDLSRVIVVRPRNPQALLRAVDALVRGGACSLVVVDANSAVALHTHHCARLVAQAEKTGTALVVLSQGRNAALASFATLRLCGAALAPLWQRGDDGGAQLLGYEIELEISKARTVAPGKRMAFRVTLPAVVERWPCTEDSPALAARSACGEQPLPPVRSLPWAASQ